MLDVDLAKIYGYTTKRFNEQVKNNIERFDDDFRFQLTDDEVDNLRSKFSTAKAAGETNNISSMSRSNPFAFTEQGIYMLMTVLKGDLAVSQSKKLIRMFKEMKHFIQNNSYIYKFFCDFSCKFPKKGVILYAKSSSICVRKAFFSRFQPQSSA